MRQAAKYILALTLFLIFIPCFSQCETIDIDELIREYGGATKLKRSQIEDAYKYKTISVSGTIKDVVDWDTFDERNQIKRHYYKVIFAPRTTRAGVLYETLIFYKDKEKVEPFDKGRNIETEGIIIKIIDEVGIFSIWVYGDELTPEDKFMFRLS